MKNEYINIYKLDLSVERKAFQLFIYATALWVTPETAMATNEGTASITIGDTYTETNIIDIFNGFNIVTTVEINSILISNGAQPGKALTLNFSKTCRIIV